MPVCDLVRLTSYDDAMSTPIDLLRWFVSLCPPDPQAVSQRAIGVLAAVILFMFFGVGGTAATFAMLIIIAAALMAVLDNLGRQVILRRPEDATILWVPLLHLSLLACFVWQLAGWLSQRPHDFSSVQSLASTLSLIGLVLLVQAAMRDRTAKAGDLLLGVLFLAGALSATISIALYVVHLSNLGQLSLSGLAIHRLVPIGRASHEIGSASALAVALFAGLACLRQVSGTNRALGVIAIGIIALTILLTQSRGPLLGLLIGPLVAIILRNVASDAWRPRLAIAALIVGFAFPVLLILFEAGLKGMFCTSETAFCRGSYRLEIWVGVLAQIKSSPWFGFGPEGRFLTQIASHPHNVLLGSAFYFGMPILLPIIALFGGATYLAARRPIARLEAFTLMCLSFAAINLATDRPNIFGDLNAHFLYVWLPIGLAFSLPRKA